MPLNIRELTEGQEKRQLSAFAARSAESRGRCEPEPPDPVRTCWQRDRDRILHSKPFRRLKHKTQVFIDPSGDHYRTRLTHTLEVAQIARTIGRALRLNEDLIEAIALGHDAGHTPFGHAGERALDRAMAIAAQEQGREPEPFRHFEQSLRVFDVLTPLNLTQEVREGISGHSKGRADLSAADGEAVSTMEAAVVRISDRIAYLNHDLDDALRSGIIPAAPRFILEIGATHGDRITRMVGDAIENSLNRPAISLSPPLLQAMNDMKEWLFENVYLAYPLQMPDIGKAEHVVETLFLHFARGGARPEGYDGFQGAVDYVAGMTDRFAVACYEDLFIPRAFSDRIKRVN
jgi:dGTPase